MKLTPDKVYDCYQSLTPKILQKEGITALLLDVDNTLAPYEQPTPDAPLLAWISQMQASGIRLAIVSNNSGERIHRFAKDLGLPVFPKAK